MAVIVLDKRLKVITLHINPSRQQKIVMKRRKKMLKLTV